MAHDNIADILIAVRAFCRGSCCGGSTKEVERCNRTACPLYPYRSRSAFATGKPTEQARNLDGQLNIGDFAHLFGRDV